MTLVKMYVTLLPLILAGVANMAFCKSVVLSHWYQPIDGGRLWRDGRPLFGGNKTWKGFFGMVVWTGTFQLVFALIAEVFPSLACLSLLEGAGLGVLGQTLFGCGLGLAYVLAELPNSFMKRRLAVAPGQASRAWYGHLLTFFDQVDSLFACVGLLALYYPMTVGFYLFYVVLGGLTHLVINAILYACKLRKTRF